MEEILVHSTPGGSVTSSSLTRGIVIYCCVRTTTIPGNNEKGVLILYLSYCSLSILSDASRHLASKCDP